MRALDSDAKVEAEEALTEEERCFAERARAANTRRAYRADLADFAGWCERERRSALPASPANADFLPHVPGPTWGQGAHHEPAPVIHRLRPPLRRPAQSGRQPPGPRRLGGHPTGAGPARGPGSTAHAPGAVGRPRGPSGRPIWRTGPGAVAGRLPPQQAGVHAAPPRGSAPQGPGHQRPEVQDRTPTARASWWSSPTPAARSAARWRPCTPGSRRLGSPRSSTRSRRANAVQRSYFVLCTATAPPWRRGA